MPIIRRSMAALLTASSAEVYAGQTWLSASVDGTARRVTAAVTVLP